MLAASGVMNANNAATVYLEAYLDAGLLGRSRELKTLAAQPKGPRNPQKKTSQAKQANNTGVPRRSRARPRVSLGALGRAQGAGVEEGTGVEERGRRIGGGQV